MSSIPFERYDEEFLSLTKQVQSSLSNLNGIALDVENQSPESAESKLRMTSNLLSQCDDLLKQMSIEARGTDDSSLKKKYLQQVRVCKGNYANLKDDYASAKTQIERSSLFSSSNSNSNASSISNDAKARLLSTNQSLASQNDTLSNARKIMAETEEVALEITSELGRNRETIASAHSRVRDVSGLTNRARRVLQSMQRREVQQRLAVYGVGVVLFFVVVFVIRAMR